MDEELQPCAICESLLLPDYLGECGTCGESMCDNCSCFCNRPTAEQAVSAAQSFLTQKGLPLMPNQTLTVEDDNGVIFGLAGQSDWLTKIPGYEDVKGLEFYLPSEFARRHERNQQKAINDGQAGYITEHFAVALKRFDIEERIFTVSVFDPVILKTSEAGI